MGLPSFQSVSTLAPKKYCLAVAGFTRASHTSELDPLMTTEALDTCSRCILGFAPLLTHDFSRPISIAWINGPPVLVAETSNELMTDISPRISTTSFEPLTAY